MDLSELSDLQILRVSKGANELKRLINYWSKSSNSSEKQDYIVNDLLRAAMELQESLLMLARLQNGSSKMLLEQIRQSEREKFEEKYSIDLIRQEQKLSFDSSSTQNKQEMKQVIRDRLNKFDNKKVPSTKNLILSRSKVEFSSQEQKKKTPNLIAKLMGLEDFISDDEMEVWKGEELMRSKSHVVKNKSLDEIIETMRSTGFLKSNQSMNLMAESDLKYEENLRMRDDIPPIVIMKFLNLPYVEGEEENLISEASDFILEDRVSDTDYEFSESMEQSEVMSFEKEKIEPPQKLKTVFAESQKQMQREDILKERKKNDDSKKMEIKGKKQVKLMNMNFLEKRRSENLQDTERFTSEKNRSNEKCSKEKFLVRSASLNSISSVKEEKISAGIPSRKSNKLEDTKSKHRKLNGTLTESHVISGCKSILAADSLLKQVQKEPTKPSQKANL